MVAKVSLTSCSVVEAARREEVQLTVCERSPRCCLLPPDGSTHGGHGLRRVTLLSEHLWPSLACAGFPYQVIPTVQCASFPPVQGLQGCLIRFYVAGKRVREKP